MPGPEVIERAREFTQREAASKSPGLSIAVGVDGQIVWSEQFGWADLARRIPVTPATLFRIGSVSKPLTAAAMALLVERGLLDLDLSVQSYIPDYPATEGVITPRLAAGHLSGIRNYRGVEAFNNVPVPNLRAGLKTFENDPLESPPGTRFSYASYNWNLLGAVMEAACKKDFLTCMQESVIGPLGLKSTRAQLDGEAAQDCSSYYEIDPRAGEFVSAPLVSFSAKWPSGGFLSTAEDLVRFGSAHLRPGFLKAESLRALFTSQKTAAGEETHYGMGWFVGPAVLYHGGDSLGGCSILLLIPAARIVVAMLSNCGQGIVRNAMRRKLPGVKGENLLYEKEAVAIQIAKIFANKPSNGGKI
jgi:CubicO group peptidase (beta-lactamase class C family)